VVYTEYPTGEHFADMPQDDGHCSAVMERLPVAGPATDRTTEILADMLEKFWNPGKLARIAACECVD